MTLQLDQDRGPISPASTGQRQFKKHKPLPRPQGTRESGPDISPSKRPNLGLAIDTHKSASASHTSSPSTLKSHRKRTESSVELPPTPPTHSRTSSSTHSALPSSPTLAESHMRTPKKAPTMPPTTPPEQRSPPTPDVTPPQPATRPKALRPSLLDRGTSRSTTVDSRTDSFRTAREEPLSSEEEDGKSTIRGAVASGRTSQSTVRKVSNNVNNQVPNPRMLDMALARLTAPSEDSYTPKTRSELAQFDGKWDSGSDEPESDDNLNQVLTVKKRQPAPPKPQSKQGRRDVVEEANNTVVAINATKAVRHMSLHDKTSPRSSKSQTSRATRSSSGPSNSDTSVTTSQKRSSGMSSRSATSTVVEAFLIDAPQKPPQKQRTLRHVRKQSALRDPIERTVESVPAPIERGRSSRPPLTNPRPERGRHDSYASNMTVSSVSSGKARREVWKSGGIPVVVVPDRRSSRSQSREPSLRSTSSRRSNRTQSLGSAPPEVITGKETGPVFERPSRRSRAYSLSDSFDTRTIDFPPAIPARSSSLSAPTSRNTSRAGSMTADSLRARDAIRYQSQHSNGHPPEALPIQDKPMNNETEHGVPKEGEVKQGEPKQLLSPVLLAPSQFASPKADSDTDSRFESDRHEDVLLTRKFSSRNTPFSIASVETNGTAPEVSEALAVHMYSHQNSSLLMVNHSARPSEVSDDMRQDQELQNVGEQPIITTTSPDDAAPVTPPQPRFLLDDVDSPLRNPRAPPEPPTDPPAITFTSATPSGVTPAPEKAIGLGNYFEAMAEVPERRPSLVERAFSRRRRNSVSYPPNASRSHGFLSRTFSLSKRRNPSRTRGLSLNRSYPHEGDVPPEENKLHPFWRPQWLDDEFEDDGDYEQRRWAEGEDEGQGEHLKYPLVDNRPGKPKRRFSDKMKRTFAVLPARHEEAYPADDEHGPERRTIQRTPSGNLRVMRRRNSASSLRRRFSQSDRPYTAPDEEVRRSFWRGSSAHKQVQPQRRRRFSLSDSLEEIQSLPRRLSERRREKRSKELRQKISGPIDVRDGVEDMIRSGNPRDRDNTDHQLVW
ncbi:hypothetical protein ACO1O0_002025 [Amphichorda felina]